MSNRNEQTTRSGEASETDPPAAHRPAWWPHISGWWIAAALTLLVLWSLSGTPAEAVPVVPLPYTAFLAQVKAGNVATLEFVGDQISGAFVDPVLWPAPSANTTPLPQATAVSPPVGAGGVSDSENAVTPGPPVSYSLFETIFPAVAGDPDLLPLLECQGVEVVAHTQAPGPFSGLLGLAVGIVPFLLLIGFLVYMGRRAGQSQSQSGLFTFGRSRARVYDQGKDAPPPITFADVAGADEAKADLQQVVAFLKQPERYRKLGARMPRGVLLVGPPGTGKTLLAKAVAGEAQVPFFSLSASEFVEMLVGVGASRVRDLFEKAGAAAPSIMFIDELDAVGRRRGTGMSTVNDEREQTLNQLLVAMDGFDANQAVIVLAATNRPDVLDPALLRPGRFDRQVIVGLPDRPGREAILRIHTRHLPLASAMDLDIIARNTTGFSGADLANLANEAALLAAQRDGAEVTMADFATARDKILLGDERHVLIGPEDRRVVAYHESGHALVAWLTPGTDPVHRVTVIPHGRALGVTEQAPEGDRYNYSRSYLRARLAVMLGGRASEDLVLGDVTTGAENDLLEATRLARRMITVWGMSEDLGLAALEGEEEAGFLGHETAGGHAYSEATAAQVDQAVKELLAERYAYARALLAAHRGPLDGLVTALLEEDTVGQEALADILGPRPLPLPAFDTLALVPA